MTIHGQSINIVYDLRWDRNYCKKCVLLQLSVPPKENIYDTQIKIKTVRYRKSYLCTIKKAWTNEHVHYLH